MYISWSCADLKRLFESANHIRTRPGQVVDEVLQINFFVFSGQFLNEGNVLGSHPVSKDLGMLFK